MKRLWKRHPLVARTGRYDSGSIWRLGGFASSQDNSETSRWTELSAPVRIAGWEFRESPAEEDASPKSFKLSSDRMKERAARASGASLASDEISPILVEAVTGVTDL